MSISSFWFLFHFQKGISWIRQKYFSTNKKNIYVIYIHIMNLLEINTGDVF